MREDPISKAWHHQRLIRNVNGTQYIIDTRLADIRAILWPCSLLEVCVSRLPLSAQKQEEE